jgi:hypothetical protein
MAIVIIPDLYKKYPKKIIIRELKRMCFALLTLFVVNSIVSTAYGYYPQPMYGIISGISYGHLYGSSFNVIPIVLFALLIFNINNNRSILTFIIGMITFVLLMVSMRRSVVFVTLIGICIFSSYLLKQKQVGKVTLLLIISIAVVVSATFLGMDKQFLDRFESRFHNQQIVSTDEGRFQDFILIYEDLFVFDRYDKIFGYEFFNAPGNYGLGINGSRNLHADIPLILHASGIAGLSLFLLMIISSFIYSWRFCVSVMDKYIYFFCMIAFIVFSFTGRITQTSYAISIFLILMLPIANKSRYEEKNSFVL